jgi:hypothetical protein
MPDIDEDFDKAFEGFGEEGTPPVTPPSDPPKDDPVQEDGGKDDTEPKEPKKDDKPADEAPKDEAADPAKDEKKEEGQPKPATPPETPPAQEEPKPLTEDSIRNIIRDIRTEERTSSQALDNAVQDVMEAYYPDGLSNVLVDQNTGKQLKTPQDVVDATNGQMTTEEAAQWLMNEQFKLDQEIAKIKSDARSIAETTLKFKQDGITVLERYDPLFKAYPALQGKVWEQYKKLVKADEAKGVILSAPDMLEFYDTMLEPYRMAYEHSQKQSATAPTAPQTPPVQPGADDRLDEGGDGGISPVDDPNDFAQQVTKELAKGA